MFSPHLRSLVGCAALLAACGSVAGCKDSIPHQTVAVTLGTTDSLLYPTVGGDEQGATIVRSPKHAKVSEIRRNAETDFVATYVYYPMPGYVGSDLVQLEIVSYIIGTGPPDRRLLTIRLRVYDE